MSNYHQEITEFLNDTIDAYDLKSESSLRDMTYPECVLGFAAIKIKHEDEGLECICESKHYKDMVSLLCVNLTRQTDDTQEDLQDLLNVMIAEYYNDDFIELLKIQMQNNYQQGMIGRGFHLQMDTSNGEFTWVKGVNRV